MRNCAFIQSNGVEFQLTISERSGNPHCATVSNKHIHLPNNILYNQVEEITIYAGTHNLTKVVYYKDGNQENKSDANRLDVFCALKGGLDTKEYHLIPLTLNGENYD